MICCSKLSVETNTAEVINPVLSFRPNILWLVAEDLSPIIPAFGDSTIVTPNLDLLAKEGVCYDQFYSPAPVCAPARSAIITGMYPTRIGSNHMRTGPWYGGRASDETIKAYSIAMPKGVTAYEVVPPPVVKMFPEYLRKVGYFTSNNAKEDYQFVKNDFAWTENGKKAHWRNRKPGQPFFSVFNYNVTHESKVWNKSNDPLWVSEDLKVPIPPYLPATDIAKKDIRRVYSNILEMDAMIGNVLDQLKEDGLMDSTIIMWYSDHGGPLPRQKRMLYNSGIKVPLIIRFPKGNPAGLRDRRLISCIDLAPTILSLGGIQPPNHMDGKAFLGRYNRDDEPIYIHAAADRFDEKYDRVRAITDGRYKYIRNYRPDLPSMLKVHYRDQMPIMQELHRLKSMGSLSIDQSLWFREKKPQEELYDTYNDPHEVNNLVEDRSYKLILSKLREAHKVFQSSFPDKNMMDERALFENFWPNMVQNKTALSKYQRKFYFHSL